jgi:hypothetical protein
MLEPSHRRIRRVRLDRDADRFGGTCARRFGGVRVDRGELLRQRAGRRRRRRGLREGAFRCPGTPRDRCEWDPGGSRRPDLSLAGPLPRQHAGPRYARHGAERLRGIRSRPPGGFRPVKGRLPREHRPEAPGEGPRSGGRPEVRGNGHDEPLDQRDALRPREGPRPRGCSLDKRRGIPPAHRRTAGGERGRRDHRDGPEVRRDQERGVRRAPLRLGLLSLRPRDTASERPRPHRSRRLVRRRVHGVRRRCHGRRPRHALASAEGGSRDGQVRGRALFGGRWTRCARRGNSGAAAAGDRRRARRLALSAAGLPAGPCTRRPHAKIRRFWRAFC